MNSITILGVLLGLALAGLGACVCAVEQHRIDEERNRDKRRGLQ